MIKNVNRLKGLSKPLKDILLEASKGIDFSILEGARSRERQIELISKGKSKINPLQVDKAPHVIGNAVDIVPEPFEGWGDFHPRAAMYQINVLKNAIHERGRFYYLAGYINAVAYDFKIPLRWGGDWDGDGKFKDQVFDDLVHFELRGL